MHVVFSNGIFGGEVMLFSSFSSSLGVSLLSDIRVHIDEGHWHNSKKLMDCFSAVREASSGATLKAGASELLVGYPMLRHFIRRVFGTDAKEPEVTSMMLLCDICDQIRLLLKVTSKVEVEIIARHLEVLSKAYLKAFVVAYGKDAVRFKHHQLLHIARQIIRNKLMLSAWVVERKHQDAKLALGHLKNLRGIESKALLRMLNIQASRLQTPQWHSHLVPPTRAFPELALWFGAAEALISKEMKWEGIQIAHSDVLHLDAALNEMLVVVACCHWQLSSDRFGLFCRRCKKLSGDLYEGIWEVDPSIGFHELDSDDDIIIKATTVRYLPGSRIEVIY